MYWVLSNPLGKKSWTVFYFLCLNVFECVWMWLSLSTLGSRLSEWSHTFSSSNCVYQYRYILHAVMYVLVPTAISLVCILVVVTIILKASFISSVVSETTPLAPKIFLNTIFISSTIPSAQEPNPQWWISLTHCANLITVSTDPKLALHSLRRQHSWMEPLPRWYRMAHAKSSHSVWALRSARQRGRHFQGRRACGGERLAGKATWLRQQWLSYGPALPCGYLFWTQLRSKLLWHIRTRQEWSGRLPSGIEDLQPLERDRMSYLDWYEIRMAGWRLA